LKVLLDTHVWLWLQVAPERLGDALPLAVDVDNELLLSAASAWEIAIKWRLGKLSLPEPPSTYLPSRMASSGVTPLHVSHAHAIAVAELPLHHADPFDRLIVAQAAAEGAALLTADEALAAYDVDVIAAGVTRAG
jgi:PIN domain nuclease of toxin-antitoxin system